MAFRVRFRAERGADPLSAALIGALSTGTTSFELVSDLGEVALVVVSSGSRRGDAAGLLHAASAGTVVEADTPSLLTPPFLGAQLVPVSEDWLPLQPRKSSEFDFLSSAAQLLATAEDVRACVQLVVEPLRDGRWRSWAAVQAAALTEPETNLGTVIQSVVFRSSNRAPDPPRWLRTAQEGALAKSAAPFLLRATIRLAAHGPSRSAAMRVLTQLVALLRVTYGAGLNNLALAPLPDQALFTQTFNRRLPGIGFVATPDELAPLWHAPAATLRTIPGLWQAGTLVRSAREARVGDVRIGRDPEGHPVSLKSGDWNSILLVGASGGGKSTLGQRLALAAVEREEATLWIEPKSTETLNDLLERLSQSAAERLVVLDPTREPVVPLNPLQRLLGVAGSQVADGVVASLSRMGPDLGHRTDRLLRMAVTAVYDGLTDPTFIDIYTFLTQAALRARVVAALPPGDFAASFWRDEFGGLSQSQRTQWIEPALHRLSPFLADPLVRRFLAATPGIDLKQLTGTGAVIAADFSGKLGEQNGVVLANLLLSSVARMAMSRADEPAESRPRLNLFIDEAHLVNADLSRLVSLMRAFNVNIVVITQFLHQLPDEVIDALLANASSLVAFRMGERDAHLLAERFGPEFRAADLMALDNYQAAVRLVVNGQVLRPFTLLTEPLPQGRGRAWADEVRDRAIRRHGVGARQPLLVPATVAGTPVVAVEWESELGVLAVSTPGKHRKRIRNGVSDDGF